MTRELLQQALDALSAASFAHPSAADKIGRQCHDAEVRLRAALAQPAQPAFHITEQHVELLATMLHFVPTDQIDLRNELNKFCHAARTAIAQTVQPASIKSLNAMAADLLRPYLKPGQKVIWREPFRWHDDNGVLSNHYDGMDLPQLCEDFDYEFARDFYLHHSAIVRRIK